jgi:ubiquinone/menaquinone biosynthesis C-methylase UbiE
MSHLLGFAEQLPIKDRSMDVVISLSSIDHFADFRKFIGEAFRVLKKGGRILIAGHLDVDISNSKSDQKSLVAYLEKAARYFYYRKYKVGGDDHTYHFHNTKELEEELSKNKFNIIDREVFLNYFYIVAKRNE